jgi:hypothetical protein
LGEERGGEQRGELEEARGDERHDGGEREGTGAIRQVRRRGCEEACTK